MPALSTKSGTRFSSKKIFDDFIIIGEDEQGKIRG
jgi:hypothetical protein